MHHLRRQVRLAILIGAGASYGCGYEDTSKRPPLGDQLFDRLSLLYPATWGTLLDPDLVILYRGDGRFEAGMAETWRRQPDRFSDLLIDMARYFAQFSPPENDNDCYSTLLRELRSTGLLSNCGVASLNYECVFELTVRGMGIRLGVTAGVDALKFWKPHGSCNFMPPIGFGMTVQSAATNQRYYQGPVEIQHPATVETMYKQGFGLPPCMSLYAEGKATLVSEETIDTNRAGWNTWAPECDYILTIGASPNLADTHVWRPILESRANVWLIGGTDGDYLEVQQMLGARFCHLGNKFEEALPPLCRRLRVIA